MAVGLLCGMPTIQYSAPSARVIFAFFSEKRPITVTFSKFCSENFTFRGRFFPKKRKNFAINQLNVLRLQASKLHNDYKSPEIHYQFNDFFTGCLVSIFTIGINSKSFPMPVSSVQETFPTFRRRPMSDIG